VRGDSLSDLYAKVAAVLGLGLLALSGAVVDYWPVNGPLPRIATALPVPERALGRATPAITSFSANPVHRSARARATSVVAAPPDVVTVAETPVTSLPLADTVITERSASRELTPVVATSVPAQPVPLDFPDDLSSPSIGLHAMAAAVSASHSGAGTVDDTGDDGFLTSTVKKTGTSIVRTGVRTGSSIRGAVRLIGVKVRAVFPG
jgi:hypothetical protein